MPHSLPELERRRSELLRQIASLGDFRSGSITSIRGRCGKPNCHCHKPNRPGHGPNFRLTRKRKGKTVSETFPNPADLQKARREVAEFHRFQQLARDLVEVNEQICGLRPAPQQQSAAQGGKKTAEAVQREAAKETDMILRLVFAERSKAGQLDLEAAGMAFRSAMHRAGAAALAELLRTAAPVEMEVSCECGHRARYHQCAPSNC